MVFTCLHCKDELEYDQAGLCRNCAGKATETEKDVRSAMEELKSKIEFFQLDSLTTFPDIFLVATASPDSPPVPASRAILVNRSLVFKELLENKLEEIPSDTIKINNVSRDALLAFTTYLYRAEEEGCGEENVNILRDLLVLAEIYHINQLKTHCENRLIYDINDFDRGDIERGKIALLYLDLAHKYCANILLEEALRVLLFRMSDIQEDYNELVGKKPVLKQIFEDYASRFKNIC